MNRYKKNVHKSRKKIDIFELKYKMTCKAQLIKFKLLDVKYTNTNIVTQFTKLSDIINNMKII